MTNYLVETDFLFGLNAKDKLHPYVKAILGLHRKRRIRVHISSAAPVEALLVMYSRGIDYDKIIRVLELMGLKLVEYGVVDYVPITLSTMILAGRLRSKYSNLTYFDSIHIALAIENNLVLITRDKDIINVMESEGHSYIEYKDFGKH